MLKGKTIALGVSGGIAAYKAADLVSRLKKLNANVEVIMTKGACEFISPLTFQTMSGNPVHKDMFSEISNYDVEHISLAQKSDIILIAPATANTIGKIANGIADNLLTTVAMAAKSKLIFAPAMNTLMYENPMVQENMEKLKALGHEFIQPGVGKLACGDYGAGKMAEPEEIVEFLLADLVEKDLKGIKVTITAASTREPLDPVRYMTNYSSGKMGYSLAEEARNRGAEVTLITGPSNLKAPKNVKLIKVTTTEEMLKAVGDYFEDTHVLIKSAAPLDYKPEKFSTSKIKKKDSEDDTLNIKYIRNPDIAAYFGKKKKNQIIVGFAAETDDLIEHASEKLKKKNFDFIVANDITEKGAGFDVDTNIVTIIDQDGKSIKYPIMGKQAVAKTILDKVKYLIEAR